jgi:hypothetical protein
MDLFHVLCLIIKLMNFKSIIMIALQAVLFASKSMMEQAAV